MKKSKTDEQKKDQLRSEYDLAVLLKEGVRGKYVAQYRQGANIVLLEPDIAAAFPTPELVNAALRLVMQLSEILAIPPSSASPTE